MIESLLLVVGGVQSVDTRAAMYASVLHYRAMINSCCVLLGEDMINVIDPVTQFASNSEATEHSQFMLIITS